MADTLSDSTEPTSADDYGNEPVSVENTIKCVVCKVEKDANLFKTHHLSKTGRCLKCPDCGNYKPPAILSEIEKADRARWYATRKRKYHENLEASRTQAKEAYQKHKEKRLNHRHSIYYADRHNQVMLSVNWKKRNPEKVLAWKLANPDKIAKYRLKQKRNPANKLAVAMRTRVRMAINGQYGAETIDELVGCSNHELVSHLERQFSDGMSWDNHGVHRVNGPRVWHIDHIVPCAAFDLSKEEELKKCFHWSNMRPLWAIENLSKHDKIIA